MTFSDVKMERPYPAPGTEAGGMLQINSFYAGFDRVTNAAEKELAEDLYRYQRSPSSHSSVIGQWLSEEIYRKDSAIWSQLHDECRGDNLL